MIEQLTQQLKQYKILLIGDNGIDQYQYGDVNRISPEGPVPVLDFKYAESKPGMAANVRVNLETLGCIVEFVHGTKTCVKTRFIDMRSRQQLMRVDQDQISNTVKIDFDTINDYDAVVISDYSKGSVDYTVVQKIKQKFKGPIFMDTKMTDLEYFNGIFVKINEKEYKQAQSECDDLIVTLGERGAKYKGKIYPTPKIEVADVCGAGDTFLASLTWAYLEYGSITKAIPFAIRASSITVQHTGVYAPTLEELR
jgi:D-beta-D-heptose 7-phosphate kinase/D-beta-D-heptose 1-phosphate adenosyltransferase